MEKSVLNKYVGGFIANHVDPDQTVETAPQSEV